MTSYWAPPAAVTIASVMPVLTKELYSGILGAQASGTILLDSGPLAAGDYGIYAQWVSFNIAAGGWVSDVTLQHRNAANGASLITQLVAGLPQNVNPYSGNTPTTGTLWIPRRTFAANERVRLIKDFLALGGEPASAHQSGMLLVWQVA